MTATSLFLLGLLLLPGVRSATGGAAGVSAQETPALPVLGQFVQERAERAAPDDRLVVYRVDDLTGQDRLDALARDITSGDLSEETRIAALDRYVELLESGAAARAATNLVETVQELIQPPLQPGTQRVTALGRSELTLVGNEAQHAWVARFLEASRTFEGLIDVQARVLTTPVGALDEFTGGRTGSVLDDLQLQLILRAAEKLEGMELVSAPRVVFRPYARAEVSNLEQVAYIRDYELTILPDKQQEIVDPIIDVLHTGITLTTRGVPLDAGRLALHCSLEYSTADRPFLERSLRLGASGAEVTVQVPLVRSVKAEGRFDLEPGQSIVLATVDPGGADSSEPRDVLVLVTARIVLPEDDPFDEDR